MTRLPPPSFTSEPADLQKRIKETQALMQALSHWADDKLKLEPSLLVKIIRLGGKIQRFFQSSK